MLSSDKSLLALWSIPTLPQTDPLIIIEASLTSVKYAIYHVIGYYTRHIIGRHDATATTYTRTIAGGFIGGALFTIPYLFLLQRRNPVEGSGTEAESVEILYSAIAGGVGALVLGGGVDAALTAMVDGLDGPLMLYLVLYGSLRVVLGAIWIIIH
ncbi:hypothetical protein DXG01_012068 [Tephrocybe rancida]|nr:hypothetical protein DXG01_012068 [Tephrocybe rancida]